MNDSRVTISLTTSSGNTYTSSLQFTYLMEGDEGTYTCSVMILNASGSDSVEIQLLNGKEILLCVCTLCISQCVIVIIYMKIVCTTVLILCAITGYSHETVIP